MNARNILIYLALQYAGDWNLIYDSISNRKALCLTNSENGETETISEKEVDRITTSLKCKTITILDDEYPQLLKTGYKPPFVLFCYGHTEFLRQKCISFVGTRHPSKYGVEMTNKLVNELPEEYVVVSGMAMGIDACAHNACLLRKGKTIAVLGSGIDCCYPSSNQSLYEKLKQDGLVISEYPGLTTPKATSFPFRNRIVAGLSIMSVITEAKLHSGTSITTGYALDAGRSIGCVPTRANENSLCNQLISMGATVIQNSKDILDEIGHHFSEPEFKL